MDWRKLGACRSVDPETFFPVGVTGPAQRDIQVAKSVCARCEVAGQCLMWSLTSSGAPMYGVWGGTTREEREAILKKKKIPRQYVQRKDFQ